MSSLKQNFKHSSIIFALLAVLAITYISFYPSLCNGFVNWDDPMYVTGNKLVQELSWRNVKTIFTSIHSINNYHPLALLSYAVEYRLFGIDNAFFYHATNLILHLVNVLLVFWLIYLLSDSALVAFITALLFGIHPMHVESVAWISERRDVLYTAFFIGSLISYLYYTRNGHRRHYDLSLILFVMSCMSKAMAVTLPAILILMDYLKHRKIDKNSLFEKAPYFVIALAFSVFFALAWGLIGQAGANQFRHLTENFYFGLYNILFYLGKLFAPVRLSNFYPYPSSPVYSVKQLSFIIPTSLLFFALVAFSMRFTRKVFFGAFFFFVAILPVLTHFSAGPFVSVIVADRYTYVPYIGLFYMAAEGFNWLYTKKTGYRALLVIFSFGVIIFFSALTWQRCHVWKNSISLWSDALNNHADYFAYSGLGSGYDAAGDYDKALVQYNHAIQLRPDYGKIYYNRGLVLGRKGDHDAAIKDFNMAIKLNPGLPPAYYARSKAYFYTKQYKESMKDLKKAQELGYPVDPEFIEDLTNAITKY